MNARSRDDESPTLLARVARCISTGEVEVVDLTTPLSERTSVIALPPDRGQPWPFGREQISRYDHLGRDVYWNNIRMSEHTGTHFDAPIHWISGAAFDDVSAVPPERLVGIAAVLDFSVEAAQDPRFLLQRAHVESWQERHGTLPERGWLLFRTGWDSRSANAAEFLNAGDTPGIAPECADWLANETSLLGVGVETVGTDAGFASTLEPAFPCHWYLHGANKYGLTQLRNLDRLPPLGALVVASPLPIVGGSGSPARVLALIARQATR